MRVRDYRFIKPAEHALLDLFNRSFSTDFGYSELEIVEVAAIPQTQTTSLALPPNAKAKIKFVAMDDDLRGVRWYDYRRITLSSFIPPSFRFMSDSVTDDEIFMDTMLTRFLVNVDYDNFSWATNTNVNGTVTYTLTALDSNPVWIGSVEIICVDDVQLAAIDAANEDKDPIDDGDDPDDDNNGTITNSILGGEFIFEQPTPSDAWYIEHNLDCHPTVTVIDNTGDDIVGSVIYLSRDILQVVFSTPLSGTAILR